MIRLAVDTSSAQVSAALVDDGTVIASASVLADQLQGETLAPLVAEVLDRAGRASAEGIVVGVGPGPFTGLRVGLVTAAVLGRVWRVPVAGVCSLDAIAWRAVAEGIGSEFTVATDARRSEVYWSRYDERGHRLEGPVVERPNDITGERTLVGAGAERYRSLLEESGADVRPPLYPEAADLALALHHGAAEPLPPVPLYLRRPDAVEPGPRKTVSQ